MYLVIIAWLYVALMMAVAESQHPAGGWIGAVITFVLYGLAPVALVVYLLRTPHRRRRARDAASIPDAATHEPDGSRHAPGDAVAAEREEH